MGNNSSNAFSSNERLWEACRWGETYIAEACILKEGADITFTDQNFGATPLMVACHFGYLKTARMLIEQGANINAVSSPRRKGERCGKRTALHFACEVFRPSSSLTMIEAMLGWGANLAMVDDDGRTAIDLARDHHMPASVISMLEENCSVLSLSMDLEKNGFLTRTTYKKVRVEIFPVMLQAGSPQDGPYRYKMAWYNKIGGQQPLGVLSLLEATVHVEDVEKKPSKRLNIVVRTQEKGMGHHTTFSMESKDASDHDAVYLSNTIRDFCGSFTSPTAAVPRRRRLKHRVTAPPILPSSSKPVTSWSYTPAASRASEPSVSTSYCMHCAGHRCHCAPPSSSGFFRGRNPMRSAASSSCSGGKNTNSNVLSKIAFFNGGGGGGSVQRESVEKPSKYRYVDIEVRCPPPVVLGSQKRRQSILVEYARYAPSAATRRRWS